MSSAKQQLSENLSRRLADQVIAVLKAHAFDSPLVAVELNYRSADDYLPMVIAFTEKEQISGFPVTEAYTEERMLSLNQEDFEPEITKFTDRVLESEEFDDGDKMLRETARLVTTGAAGNVPVAEGFVAFAIDWETDFDEFSKILTDCGADSKSLALWKERGWLS